MKAFNMSRGKFKWTVAVVSIALSLLVAASVYRCTEGVGEWWDRSWKYGDRWTLSKIKDSQRAGDRVVGAIEQFKAEHGRYPQSLGQLTPAYFDKLPLPTAGDRKWNFRSSPDLKSYEFSFSDNGHPFCAFRKGAWHVTE